jgi:hypothetical protein
LNDRIVAAIMNAPKRCEQIRRCRDQSRIVLADE